MRDLEHGSPACAQTIAVQSGIDTAICLRKGILMGAVA
jgi:hypothetical protein